MIEKTIYLQFDVNGHLKICNDQSIYMISEGFYSAIKSNIVCFSDYPTRVKLSDVIFTPTLIYSLVDMGWKIVILPYRKGES